MQKVYEFLGEKRSYLVLAVAVATSLGMMAISPSEKLGLSRGVALGFLEAGHWLFSWPMDISGLRYENQVLREQNLRISMELLKLREARLENARLRELLNFKNRELGPYLAAKVIARDPDRITNTILINIGKASGVEERMTVLTADGLVGRVLESHQGTAVVQMLLDRNCRVSAIVQREERTQGIVTCEDGTFFLKHMGIRSSVEVGNRVISSGMGGIFPKGLLVGEVIRVGQEQQGLFREVVLKPSVNFLNLEEVFVLKRPPNQN
jgi:rod shape-determining protein MreC